MTDDWKPIETAPMGKELVLYFPPLPSPRGAAAGLGEMMRIELYPVTYPRKPSHWMPRPAPPNRSP